MSDKSFREAFPDRLKYYLDIREKTRQDLVRDLGLKYTTVCDWVNGRSVPRMDKVELLANYFQCEKSELLEFKDTATEDELSAAREELSAILSDFSEAEIAVLLASLKSVRGKVQ